MDAQMTNKRADQIEPGEMMFLTLDDDTTILIVCIDAWDTYPDDIYRGNGLPSNVPDDEMQWFSEWAPVRSVARKGLRVKTREFGPYRPSDELRVVDYWG